MTSLMIALQGTHYKATVLDSPYIKEPPHKRGAIKQFSKAARKRLFVLFHKMNVVSFLFITLTYGQHFPTAKDSKRHLKMFIQRLKRKYPNVAGVWRIEFQKRHAPHYHLLLTNVKFIPKEEICSMWEEVIGQRFVNQTGKTFTRVERIKSKKHALSYVSKYVGKVEKRAQRVSGFNSVSYQTAFGKHWGIVGREHLPFAIEKVYVVECDSKTYRRFKAVFQWSTKIDKIANFTVGFTIFTERPKVWLELLLNMLNDENHIGTTVPLLT